MLDRLISSLTAAEGAKIVVDKAQMSQNMQEFISTEFWGDIAVSGTDADLFRVDPQTGTLTSKTFVDFENQRM